MGGTSGVGGFSRRDVHGQDRATDAPTAREGGQAVLKSLMPEVGTDIKGQMQPAERLRECSGYATDPTTSAT